MTSTGALTCLRNRATFPSCLSALAFYRKNLRDALEPAEEGKGIAIHPDSGECLVAETPTHASRAMRLRQPGHALRHPVGSYVTMRIGPSPDFAHAARE